MRQFTAIPSPIDRDDLKTMYDVFSKKAEGWSNSAPALASVFECFDNDLDTPSTIILLSFIAL